MSMICKRCGGSGTQTTLLFYTQCSDPCEKCQATGSIPYRCPRCKVRPALENVGMFGAIILKACLVCQEDGCQEIWSASYGHPLGE